LVLRVADYTILPKVTICFDQDGFLDSALRVSKRCDRATARSRKIFQRSRKILFFECKNAQFTTVLPFLGHFPKMCLFLAHFVCAKLSNRNIGRAKKMLLESLFHSNVDVKVIIVDWFTLA